MSWIRAPGEKCREVGIPCPERGSGRAQKAHATNRVMARSPIGSLGGCGLSRGSLRLSSLGLRRRLADALVHLIRKLREILDEQVDELRCRRVIFRRIGPGAFEDV